MAGVVGSSGYQVEFVDDAGAPRRAPDPDGRAHDGRRGLVGAGLWLAAAALCVLASFQTIFTYHFTGRAITSHGGYDAWGHPLDQQLNGEHGPRYAVLLWSCAVLFALLAAVLLRGGPLGRAGRWVRQHVPAIALGAAAFLVGALGGVGLGVESSFASYRALAVTLHDGSGGVDLAIGGCLWFGLGALACAIAAIVVCARHEPTSAGSSDPPA